MSNRSSKVTIGLMPAARLGCHLVRTWHGAICHVLPSSPHQARDYQWLVIDALDREQQAQILANHDGRVSLCDSSRGAIGLLLAF